MWQLVIASSCDQTDIEDKSEQTWQRSRSLSTILLKLKKAWKIFPPIVFCYGGCSVSLWFSPTGPFVMRSDLSSNTAAMFLLTIFWLRANTTVLKIGFFVNFFMFCCSILLWFGPMWPFVMRSDLSSNTAAMFLLTTYLLIAS